MESPERKAKITFRVDAAKKQAYKDAVESMSGDLREYVKAVADGDDGDDPNRPDDDQLADALTALRWITDDRGRVPTDTASSYLAEQLGIPRDAVRRSVFEPLEKRGYLTPRWGTLELSEPE